VNAASAPDSVLYLIWAPGNARLSMITVFRTFEPWLVGDAKQLLHNESLDPASAPARFLGKPDRSGVTLDVSSIGLRHVTHVHDRRWMELTEQHDGASTKVVFALVSPDHPRNSWKSLP